LARRRIYKRSEHSVSNHGSQNNTKNPKVERWSGCFFDTVRCWSYRSFYTFTSKQ